MKLKACIIVSAFVLSSYIFATLGQPEPYYAGKSFRHWLRECEKSYTVPMDERAPPRSQASDAIAAIGTNALPALLTLIEARGPCLRYRFETDHGSIHWISNPKRRCRRLGWCSFQALGSKAQPGVPGLVRLLSSPDTECRAAAAIALSYIGPAAENAVIPLRDLVNDPDQHVAHRRYGLSAKFAQNRISSFLLCSKFSETKAKRLTKLIAPLFARY